MNATYIDSLNETINSADDCGVLSDIYDRVLLLQADMTESIASQLEILSVLIEPPTNLTTVIEYLSSMVDYFTGPYNALVLQQAELAIAMTTLLASISTKISELGCDL